MLPMRESQLFLDTGNHLPYHSNMTERKFYKTTITLEVLSEDEIPDSTDIPNIIDECLEGAYSLRILSATETILNGKETADALLEQASDPGFFGVDENGNDIEM